MLAFFCVYGTGNIPSVKNVKIEKGNKATDWTYAPEDFLNDITAADEKAQEAITSIVDAQAEIQLLAESISQLVRSGNSGSLLKQDSENLYYFDISDIEALINAANDGLTDANEKISLLDLTAEELKSKTEYVVKGVDENGQPYIELGDNDLSDNTGEKGNFKVRITNTEIKFMQDSDAPASINRNMLVIEKTMVKQELQFGDDKEAGVDGVWIWQKRSNGNLGLTWKEVNS
jgi:hypothetical protein